MSKDKKIALIYIGSVLPDTEEFNTPAFSRAGTMSQRNLLYGMRSFGIKPDIIVSFRQIQSYPGSKSILIKGSKTSLFEQFEIKLLPFININPIKQIIIGLLTIYNILNWGWKNRKVNKKIVFTFNLSVPSRIFTLIGARIIGAKAVVSLNDINIPGQTVSNTFLNKLDYFLHKKLIPKFDGHIAVADQIMSDFSPNSKYIRIEGGISDTMLDFFESQKEKKVIFNDLFHIVSAGSLDEANGFHILLKAFSLLHGDHYRLSIAGDGPLRQDVVKAAKSDHRITYHGYLPVSEVLSLYTTADVLINIRLTKLLNTKYFYPSKMMEYLASGTPVITTATGHTEAEFGPFVYLLKDESSEGLADIIHYVSLLDNSERLRLGYTAQKYMRNNKTWDIQGGKVATYLMEMFE